MDFELINEELKFDSPRNDIGFETPKVGFDYNNASNKPSINGKELKGNLTTEDLGIENGSDIELITELKPESIEEDLKPNQVYNGNAIHDLARLFGLEMANVYEIMPLIVPDFDIEATYEDNEVYNANAIHQLLELFVYEITMIQEGFEELRDATVELYEQRPFEVYGTFTLSTQKLTGITSYYNEIKKAYENGRPIKLKVTIAESGNIAMADISVLDIRQNKAFFYPIMFTNIGNGMGDQVYFFNVEIGENTGNLTPYILQAIGFGE